MFILEAVGSFVLRILETWGGFIILLFQTLKQCKRIPRMRYVLQQMAHLGVDTLPIVMLTMLFTGMVVTLQTVTEFIKFGAQSTIGGVVTIAVGRELGPVLVGVVAAGRVGAAITAELSTMKVTEQIDALEVMATNPIRYLVVPRLIACMVMLPLLVVFGDVIGSFGGWVIANYYDVSSFMYMQSINSFVVIHDFTGGLIKAVVFGSIIAIIGCYYGLNAGNGAEGVGKAATKSVVDAIMAIFFFNCFLSLLLYR
ncbi:MlaE family ABC transporter permease [Pectinatus cerevisiiphilus]|uniref:Phospholipid/cholesterol/gamma-HCH transport system permease protein n=1 Tax=Pectinatus cerevisiiphilus TaxID=86956 RepID=A0A4R3KC27_9FIRM|nr:ABC transporter permease [Pectinatus cerevisiiphilus]TCS80503.1 phospholipid/cholesterol/gamma-HCH transport system permease protein [Pectinatus cerevisiiphilus]